MQLDAILEVAIGLVFAWLVLSVATMEIQNWIGQLLDWRAEFLEKSILQMFKNESSLVDQFYDHPAIREISKLDKKGRFKKPDYIPNQVFAEAALEVLVTAWINSQEVSAEKGYFGLSTNREGGNVPLSPEIQELMGRLFRSPSQVTGTRDILAMSLADVRENLVEYHANVREWFDTVMAQASAWYKQNAMNWAFVIGLVLALAFNVDTVHITNQLWVEPTIRQALVAQAEDFELEPGTDNITQVPGYFDSLAVPVGWTTIPAEQTACSQLVSANGALMFWVAGECRALVNVPPVNDPIGWLVKAAGILLSAFAARQGAPFWFDLLRKLVSLRPSQGGSQAVG